MGMRTGGRDPRCAPCSHARRNRDRSPRQTRALRAGIVLVVLIATLTSASEALAVFPFVGKGTLAEPSSWKLAPGETLSNLGGELIQHFGAVPQTPPAEPLEKAEVEKL